VLPVKRKNSRLDNTVKAGEARLTCLDVTTMKGIVFMEGQATCVVCSFLFGHHRPATTELNLERLGKSN
jgi:hypothetical protein